MKKRFRLELTGEQLAVLFVIAHDGIQSVDGAVACSTISKRDAREVRAKLVALLDKRDRDDRAREQIDSGNPIHPALLDGSHDPESHGCACAWCDASTLSLRESQSMQRTTALQQPVRGAEPREPSALVRGRGHAR